MKNPTMPCPYCGKAVLPVAGILGQYVATVFYDMGPMAWVDGELDFALTPHLCQEAREKLEGTDGKTG